MACPRPAQVAATFAGIYAPRKNTRGSRDQLSDMCDTTHYDLLVSTPVQLAHFDTFVLQYKTTAFSCLSDFTKHTPLNSPRQPASAMLNFF